MSDSRWYTNRNKVYSKHGRSWDDVSTPTQKRFKKRRASRHNRRSMKQHLIVHAHVIPAHGRVINQTGKTKSKHPPLFKTVVANGFLRIIVIKRKR